MFLIIRSRHHWLVLNQLRIKWEPSSPGCALKRRTPVRYSLRIGSKRLLKSLPKTSIKRRIASLQQQWSLQSRPRARRRRSTWLQRKVSQLLRKSLQRKSQRSQGTFHHVEFQIRLSMPLRSKRNSCKLERRLWPNIHKYQRIVTNKMIHNP